MESGQIKVDQIRKQYDFKIKGAKIFAACNEIRRLSKPLQYRDLRFCHFVIKSSGEELICMTSFLLMSVLN